VLDERKKILLYAVVDEYILAAQPVGSKNLVKRHGLDISSATVRNELALLEEMGFLTHPHTSAGRIPTDKGYRLYVDSLIDASSLTPAEEKSIFQFYSMLSKEIEDLMRETSNLLANITNYLAIVFAPTFKKSVLKHVDLVSLYPHAVLIVIVTNTGWVAKRVLELQEPVEAFELEEVEKVLNERLASLDFDEISLKGRVELRGLLPGKWFLVEKIVDEIIDCLRERENRRVFLGGTANLLRLPEFESLEKIRTLLQVLEEGYSLLRLIEGALETSSVVVKIGSENEGVELRDCSLVAVSYRLGGESLGTIGILGPVRMDYARAISAVQCIAKNLTYVLESLRS
jgi:heat-inducible transcriptional repressor